MRRVLTVLLAFSLIVWSMAGVLPPGVARAEGQLATNLTVSQVSAQYSDQVALSAALTSENGGVAGKTVEFRVDGTYVMAAITDASGLAVIPYAVTLPQGTYSIEAFFYGDEAYQMSIASGSLWVYPEDAILMYVGETSASADRTLTLAAQVNEVADGYPGDLSGETVRFTIQREDGVVINTLSATVSRSGYAAVSTPLPVDQYTVTVDLSWSRRYIASSATASIAVERAVPSLVMAETTVLYGEAATVKVALTAGGGPLAGKTVAFRLNGQPVGTAVTDASGLAQLTVSAPAAKGSYPMEASFAGDNIYLPATAAAQLTVKPLQPVLSVSDYAAQYSDLVNLTATMTLNGTPVAGKTVTFKVDGAAAGTATTDASGIAALSWQTLLAAGTYRVEAAFSGDNDPAYASASGAGALSVVAEDATLAYTGNTRSSKGSLFLQATLSQAADGQPGDYTRAGSVRFTLTKASDGSVIAVYSAPVDANGRASLTVPAPSATVNVHVELEPNGYFTAPPIDLLKVR